MAIVIGDIHGRWYDLYRKFQRIENTIKNTDIFILGDVGVGFNEHHEFTVTYPKLNEYMVSLNSTLYFIRGNHDNPNFFKNNSNDLSNIKFVPDYSIIKTTDTYGVPINVFTIGGGTSIDRLARVENIDYWKDEKIPYDVERLSGIKNIDVILSHSAPNFVTPLKETKILLDWYAVDEKLKPEIILERKLMNETYEILKQNNNIKKWYYGHFHMSDKMYYENVEFNALNVLEIKDIEI